MRRAPRRSAGNPRAARRSSAPRQCRRSWRAIRHGRGQARRSAREAGVRRAARARVDCAVSSSSKSASRRAAASFALCIGALQPRRARSVAKPCESAGGEPDELLDRPLDREADRAHGLVDGLDGVDGAVGRLVELVELVVDAVDGAAGLVDHRQHLALRAADERRECGRRRRRAAEARSRARARPGSGRPRARSPATSLAVYASEHRRRSYSADGRR